MSNQIRSFDGLQLRSEIIEKCTWGETYHSVKQIFRHKLNQLPLLIKFVNNDNNNNNRIEIRDSNPTQTILFFDRHLSKKYLLAPLHQPSPQATVFQPYPKQCILLMTEYYKGLIEFIIDGQRSCRIFLKLEELIEFATNLSYSIVFMSRDRSNGYFQDSPESYWQTKKYSQGPIFRAQRIHHAVDSYSNNNYLECIDEQGYVVFLKMDLTGRFSLIATSTEQEENHSELYLHSTQTNNLNQIIQRVLPLDSKTSLQNCIRLVRGSTPNNFNCQYFQFIREEIFETLIGVTEENLMVEWNLASQEPCQYATNLNEVFSRSYGKYSETALKSSIDKARQYHQNQFRMKLQIFSNRDWNGFRRYWKWIGKIPSKSAEEINLSYSTQRQYHLIASIQDLSDHARVLLSAYKKIKTSSRRPVSQRHIHRTNENSNPNSRPRSFFAEMSKRLSTSNGRKLGRPMSLLSPHLSFGKIMAPESAQPFDDSIYDSNNNTQTNN